MARSFRLIVPVVVAAVVFALLVVLPPPLAMSAAVPARPSSRFGPGGYSNSLKMAAKTIKKLYDLLKQLTGKGRGQLVENYSADSVYLFVFNLTVGTSAPPQNIPGVLDINSELVWSQCSPCSSGAAASCLPPPAPVFEPNRSSTFAPLPCGSQTCQQVLNETCSSSGNDDGRCEYTDIIDGGSSNTTGYLANDTFTFGATPVPGFLFGCTDAIMGNLNLSGASGVFGFSRGPLSMVSQLQLPWFSYLLAPDSDDNSRIQFGGEDGPPQTKNSRSTPLINSTLYPDQYSVNLTGVRVDGNDLAGDIPAETFGFRANGSGGVFLSTTYPLTLLEQAAYVAVRKAIAGGITAAQPVNGSEIGLDLCYTTESLQNVTIPELALVFDGDDAVMDLQRNNYFFADDDIGLECLSIMPSTGFSLLGSLLQTGTAMTYDIDNARLIFDTTAAQTAAAASPAHPLTTMMLLYHLAVWVVLF